MGGTCEGCLVSFSFACIGVDGREQRDPCLSELPHGMSREVAGAHAAVPLRYDFVLGAARYRRCWSMIKVTGVVRSQVVTHKPPRFADILVFIFFSNVCIFGTF